MSSVVISFDTDGSPLAAVDAVATAFEAAFPSDGLAGVTDDPLLECGSAIERLGRLLDARRVEWAAEVGERSRRELGSGSLAARKGCRTAVELVQRVTRVSGATAARLLKLGAETRTGLSLTGVEFPARFPLVARALNAGALGLDSARAIVAGLIPTLDHVAIDDLHCAETELVSAATGTSPDSPVACTADETATQASQWRAWLDPDGIQPSEERAMTQRAFSRGTLRGGLMRGTYALLPEIAGKVDRLMHAYQSPKTAGVFLSDEARAAAEAAVGEGGQDQHTDEQQRHDIFASAIDAASRSGETPSIGGAAPTVLVSVLGADLARGRGVGWIDGVDSPVSFATVKQFICSGGTQSVRFDGAGRIIELGSPQRCFTPQQRRAITLRDGGCLIPGCQIPSSWCEIHHVLPDAEDGPTHTDNGVLLCWFHHRTITTSGWQIRMKSGVPQIKAPPWIQWDSPWRPASKSRSLKPPSLQPPSLQPPSLQPPSLQPESLQPPSLQPPSLQAPGVVRE